MVDLFFLANFPRLLEVSDIGPSPATNFLSLRINRYSVPQEHFSCNTLFQICA